MGYKGWKVRAAFTGAVIETPLRVMMGNSLLASTFLFD